MIGGNENKIQRAERQCAEFKIHLRSAIGLPLLCSVITYIGDRVPFLPKNCKPQIGKSFCFFSS